MSRNDQRPSIREGKMSKHIVSTENSTKSDPSEAQRKRSIRQWIDKKLKRWAGRGFAGFVPYSVSEREKNGYPPKSILFMI